ncbi:hypothetical protein ACHAXA_005132 [Cyclostephanos tholiformis]|uniref:PH domain-containing protein n=1 Tax=Cyclostephanos tholiformis TaxID=382380 RepID=A0ABD3RX89_9STRA
MVLPVVMAASGAASAGATALGLKIDQKSVDLTKEIFLLQMRQTKRLFTAQWAEASYRYGEAMAQAAQQHCEDMALAKTAYLQAERINSQQFKLARDQDSRSFEMSFRTEARESLRDELANQFNRYNIVMLCDTVSLGCVYGLVVEGAPPEGTSEWLLILYLFSLGGSIMFFSVSLWFCVTIVRRLHEHTASIMERKLFSDDEQLQSAWQEELVNGLPTGPNVMHLVNQAYSRWLSRFINPLGHLSINMMILGVVMMFICAGLLTHTRYTIQYDSFASASIFWVTVFIATFIIIFSKIREDAFERKKEGVYDKSYLDAPTTKGPMAKVKLAADELFTRNAVRLGSFKRATLYRERKNSVNEFVPDNSALFEKAESLRRQWEFRAKQRQDVLETLTAAVEEIDALPADLLERVNKIIHDVDEADKHTARYVSMNSKKRTEHSETNLDRDDDGTTANKQRPMPDRPIDAQYTPVSLTSLRKKLGEFPVTTMIRIRNLTNEPLRLKSGAQLDAGQYIKDLEVSMIFSRHNRNQNVVGDRAIYRLFPIAEIPIRTEVVIAARSTGNKWFPTSGIDGELVFVNKSGTWIFHIHFSNGVGLGGTSCRTMAMHYADPKLRSDVQIESGEAENSVWKISHETIDQKRNNEVLVQINVMPPQFKSVYSSVHDEFKVGIEQGSPSCGEGFEMELGGIVHNERELNQPHLRKVETSDGSGETDPCSREILMNGIMFEQVSVLDPRFMWQQRWCELSSLSFVVFQHAGSTPEVEVPLDEITKIRAIPDMADGNVFHIYSNGRKPIILKTESSFKREQWIERISNATGSLYVADWGDIPHGEFSDPEPLPQPLNMNTLQPSLSNDVPTVAQSMNLSDREQGKDENSLKRLKAMDLLLGSFDDSTEYPSRSVPTAPAPQAQQSEMNTIQPSQSNYCFANAVIPPRPSRSSPHLSGLNR